MSVNSRERLHLDLNITWFRNCGQRSEGEVAVTSRDPRFPHLTQNVKCERRVEEWHFKSQGSKVKGLCTSGYDSVLQPSVTGCKLVLSGSSAHDDLVTLISAVSTEHSCLSLCQQLVTSATSVISIFLTLKLPQLFGTVVQRANNNNSHLNVKTQRERRLKNICLMMHRNNGIKLKYKLTYKLYVNFVLNTDEPGSWFLY